MAVKVPEARPPFRHRRLAPTPTGPEDPAMTHDGGPKEAQERSPSLSIVEGNGADIPARADHPDAHRPIELHKQTAHKLEVIRRYDPVFGAIMAQGDWHGQQVHIFLVDTHGGGGQHLSIERGWTYGSPAWACFSARDIQRRHSNVQVHVRAIESDPAAAHLLRLTVQRHIEAKGTDHVDVRVIDGDYRDHLAEVMDEVRRNRAACRVLVDPHGIDIPLWTLAPLLKPAWGLEVIINFDASGALRVAHQLLKKGGLAESSDFDDLLLANAAHQSALGEMFGGSSWRAAVRKGMTWHDALESIARADAELFAPYFAHRNVYRLRSSDNQVRYLVHLARHPLGVTKFREAFGAASREGLLATRFLDGPGRSAVAASFHALYRGTETTIERLHEEHGHRYDKRALRGICEASDQDLYGVFDPKTDTISWFPKRRKPTQTTLFGHLDLE
jgi:three-Cys-motif partner protein